VLSLLGAIDGDPGDRRWLLALRGLETMIDDFGLDPAARRAFVAEQRRGYLALLLALSVPLALLTFCLASVQVGLALFTRHRRRQFMAEGLEVQAKSQSYLVEILSAVETLKSRGAERRAVERWSALFARELNISLKRGRLDAMLDSLSASVKSGSAMALLAAAAMQVLAGRLTLGDMMALAAVAGGFLIPLINLVSSGAQLQLLAIYLERLNDVLETETERERTGSRRISRLSGAIAVEGVSFRYGPISPFVIQNVSVHIREGEFLALVGRTGSGKSTLARLLVGLYAPTIGRICYDGVDLTQLDMTTLRRQIGVVTQQAQLFLGSIRSNIALSDPSLPQHRVIRAATVAQMHDEIMSMPMGYDTPLIDRGASLSGGQQQRVSLARALITQPRILVLDEATSQLDAATERAVQDQLAVLPCTRIVIAHRLSTIMRADRILVMDDGRIVEEGAHADLLAKNREYARLVAAQVAAQVTMTR
jgi:ATP-binding cassette, subfamily B, bacterial